MKKSASKRIKNSTLVVLFFLLVIAAIVISIIVKTTLLIAHSKYDGKHQFSLEITGGQKYEIVSFNPNLHTVSTLFIKGAKREGDVQSLEVPIDAVYALQENAPLQSLQAVLFRMIFRCRYPVCKNLNSVDALKLYMFVRQLRPDAVQTATISLPVSQLDFKDAIQPLFTDETIYHEALSISIVNSSGESGLGNKLSQLLTNIGCNIVSVRSGDIQSITTMESSHGNESYTVQQLQKILGIQAEKMQGVGISDIVITVGEKHPRI